MKRLLLIWPFLLSCSNHTYFRAVDKTSSAFLQSLPGNLEEEVFTLEVNKSKVDLLIFLDTSESMHHHLDQFGHSLKDLLYVISDYDWQLSLASVDHGDATDPTGLQQNWRDHVWDLEGRFGSLMNLENEVQLLNTKILTPRTPNYEEVFFQSLSGSSEECDRPPYCHSALEQPLRSLKSAMERAVLDNASFFRPTADFVSLIITNEDERTEDKRRATSARQVLETFNKTFGHLDKKFLAFNFIITDEDCLDSERYNSEAAQMGDFVGELAHLTGGYNVSICSQNYGRALRKLSEHIKNSLENSILLEKEPMPETVEVEFLEGPELSWSQYGRNIFFEKEDSEPVSVRVFYQSGG